MNKTHTPPNIMYESTTIKNTDTSSSSLSNFVRGFSSRDKKKVFMEVLKGASEDQKALVDRVNKK